MHLTSRFVHRAPERQGFKEGEVRASTLEGLGRAGRG
jgi:hypothetical protein